tara:strand:- start:350 stop:850 length:501 start_codon:yes stop_codon:yes gene_type:complete
MKIETKDQIVVTGLAKKGGAFGLVLPDLEESVYIGVRILEQSGAKLLDKCDAVLTSNHHVHSHNIPHLAAYLRVVEAEPEVAPTPDPAPEPELDPYEAALGHIREAESYVLTAEMSELLEIPSRKMGAMLEKMFMQNKIVRAQVQASASQGKASFSMWADSPEKFR